MARDKDPAVLGPAIRGLPFPEPSLDQQGFDRTSTPNIGTSVKGIAEDVTDEALRRNLPDESRSTDRVGGQLHIVITKPLECLADAPQFAEFRECELNGFDNSPIRMLNNLAGCILYIADRKPLEQLTAARFGFLPAYVAEELSVRRHSVFL